MTRVGHFFSPFNKKITHHNTGTQLSSHDFISPLPPHLPSKNVLSRSWDALESPSWSPSERVREPRAVLRCWVHRAALQTPARLVGKQANREPNSANQTTKYLSAGRGVAQAELPLLQLQLSPHKLQKWPFPEFAWNICETQQKELKPYGKLNKSVLLGDIHLQTTAIATAALQNSTTILQASLTGWGICFSLMHSVMLFHKPLILLL